MGAWGTSLYSNDSACDIRGDYVDKIKRGKSNEEATEELIHEYCDIIDCVDEAPLFWFALADTQWNYGRLLQYVKEKALYFLSQENELERWREAGERKLLAWMHTLNKLKEKLNSPQPPLKKVSKYRLYKCGWQLGDVFAYQFSSDYSKEKGFWGKFMFFRKTSEYIYWPGHIVPLIRFYNLLSNEILSKEKLLGASLLPTPIANEPRGKTSKRLDVTILLIKESEKSIPKENIFFLGNLPGADLTNYIEDNTFTGYFSVGWQTSCYNNKIEEYFIDSYLKWNKVKE